MIIEALVTDRGRDDASIDAVHRRSNGRRGRNIVLSQVPHFVFLNRRSYAEKVRQSKRICVEAVQTSQNRLAIALLQQESR